MTITKRRCLNRLSEQCLGQLQPFNVYFVYYLYVSFKKINLLLKLKQFGCFRTTGNSQEDTVLGDRLLPPESFQMVTVSASYPLQLDINMRRRTRSCASRPQRQRHRGNENPGQPSQLSDLSTSSILQAELAKARTCPFPADSISNSQLLI